MAFLGCVTVETNGCCVAVGTVTHDTHICTDATCDASSVGSGFTDTEVWRGLLLIESTDLFGGKFKKGTDL